MFHGTKMETRDGITEAVQIDLPRTKKIWYNDAFGMQKKYRQNKDGRKTHTDRVLKKTRIAQTLAFSVQVLQQGHGLPPLPRDVLLVGYFLRTFLGTFFRLPFRSPPSRTVPRVTSTHETSAGRPSLPRTLFVVSRRCFSSLLFLRDRLLPLPVTLLHTRRISQTR